MTFSPDGKYLASYGYNNTIQLWNVDDGEKVRTILVGGYIEDYILGFVVSLTFSPNGKYILGGCQDGTIHFWDAATGAQKKILKAHGLVVSNISFSKDGTTLVTSSADGAVLIWDYISLINSIDAE